MQIKRFNGKTLQQALKKVKESFGEEAVIISTKSANGLSEVLAAIDFNVEEVERSHNLGESFKGSLIDIKRELDELKYIFSRTIGGLGREEVAKLGGSAYQVYEELLKSGIHEKLSRKLVKTAAHATNDSPDILRRRCLKVVMERTAVHNPFKGTDGPKVIALVGPKGSGKSTTVAKIAGSIKRKYNASVALLSFDVSRADESLKRSANLFEMPLDTPGSKEELSLALWMNRDNDVVLIDTPGKDPDDLEGIDSIKDMLSTGLPIETGLVLDVSASDKSQAAACRGFGALAPDYLAFTRIDEARRFGTILNTSASLKKPVAFLCNGEKIPDDIQTPSRKFLGNLVLTLNEGGV
jgi:flagellar biosynthesis protein FlhF